MSSPSASSPPAPTKTKRNRNEGDADDESVDPAPGRKVLRGFRLAHVFDIAQTDGDTVRPPARPTLLEGEAPEGLWEALAAQVTTAGYELRRAGIESGANGTTNYTTRTVTVADHLSPAQATKTLAHELAHVLLHDGSECALGSGVPARTSGSGGVSCRGRAEVEAESVAYVVCQAAGHTTAAYSFGYVTHWSGGDPNIVKAAAERVVTCARGILDAIGHLESVDDQKAA